MYTPEALLDIHGRAHQSLAKLLDHLETMDVELLDKPLDGFGYSTIREQVHHQLGAERYWVSVLRGAMNADEDLDAYPTIASLRELQVSVAAETRAWLASVTSDALSSPAQLDTWSEKQVSLVPAHVLLRTQTHIFHHLGQVVAMCRLLGSPINGLDFPVR